MVFVDPNFKLDSKCSSFHKIYFKYQSKIFKEHTMKCFKISKRPKLEYLF